MNNLCKCGMMKCSKGKCPNPECHENTSERAAKLAPLVVYASRDGVDWGVVHPDQVPEFLKDPETMGQLVKGNMAKGPGDDVWYRAEKFHE